MAALTSSGFPESRRLDLPKGMMAPGAEMFAAGLVLVCFSLLHGEHLPAVVPGRAIAAIAYLVVFGSLVAYTAYLYLLPQPEELRPP